MSAATLTATARRLLAKNGRPVVFHYTTGGDINPATGEVTTPPTPATISGNGYPSRYKSSDVDGTNVMRTDTRLIVEKVSALPLKGWQCEVSGEKLRVMDVQRVTLALSDIIYICQLRAD